MVHYSAHIGTAHDLSEYPHQEKIRVTMLMSRQNKYLHLCHLRRSKGQLHSVRTAIGQCSLNLHSHWSTLTQ